MDNTSWLETPERPDEETGTAAMPTPALSAGARRSLKGLAASTAALLAAVTLSIHMSSDAYAAKPKLKYRVARVDMAGLDAIDIAKAYKMGGDELTVLERLGGRERAAGGAKLWTAERLAKDFYLVVFRPENGAPCAFEVDLASERVLATPEAVESLTALRVRDVSGAGASGVLVARAD